MNPPWLFLAGIAAICLWVVISDRLEERRIKRRRRGKP